MEQKLLEFLSAMEDHIGCEAECSASGNFNGHTISVTKGWNPEKGYSYGIWSVDGKQAEYPKIKQLVL